MTQNDENLSFPIRGGGCVVGSGEKGESWFNCKSHIQSLLERLRLGSA